VAVTRSLVVLAREGQTGRQSVTALRREMVLTCEANEEAGNVYYVGREARLVVVHGVLLARLVPYDVD